LTSNRVAASIARLPGVKERPSFERWLLRPAR
jgi:hypothetical protein